MKTCLLSAIYNGTEVGETMTPCSALLETSQCAYDVMEIVL